MKRILSFITLTCLCIGAFSGYVEAQTVAAFNFSLASKPVTGWRNIYGSPAAAVRKDSVNGITVSSVATANWVPYGSTGSAYDGLGAANTTFFPTAVMANHWYNYGTTATFNVLAPQLQISGLRPDSVYTIEMGASSTSSLSTASVQYTVAGYNVSASQYVNNHNNTANGATFYNVVPDTAGIIRVYVNTNTGTDVADISGLRITSAAATPLPVVTFTSPVSGAVLTEGSDVTVTATATISTGTVSKLQFYQGATLLGTATSSPYTTTWHNVEPGSYTLTAKATDYLNRITSTSIGVTVASNNDAWSTTGNIATNGDSSFVGTVDTNRLSFRTNNLERMTILKDGTIGIGTKSTYGYQLAVNGSAIFTKVKVKTAGTWPDYVFKPGYQLPDLQELEQFLHDHKHLPGVASETEVAKYGIDVADHQAALLKKVEELTLYLIQENKALKDQHEQLRKQRALIEKLQQQIEALEQKDVKK